MFELINNQVVIDPDLMSYPEFRTIWERDMTPDKEESFAYYSFIFNYNNPKSIYHKNYAMGNARRDAIIYDLFPDHMKKIDVDKDKIIAGATKIYVDGLRLSPLRNVLEISKQVIADISKKLLNGKVARDVKLSELGRLNKAIEEYKKAEKAVNDDEINNVKGERHIKASERT